MSRIGSSDTVVVRPTNNIYTVLVIAALLIVLGALLALYMRAETVFGPGGLLK
jgi:hypothetical protein